MARMRSGFAVIGETQHLPGYSLLLTDDPSVNQCAYSDAKHGELRAAITAELHGLIEQAY